MVTFSRRLMFRAAALFLVAGLAACSSTPITGPVCTGLDDPSVPLILSTQGTAEAMQDDIAAVMAAPPVVQANATRRAIRSGKHILAISVGGQNGAFSSGFLTGWSERGTRPTFDIVTGASAGALVAPVAFVGSEFDGALRRNTGIDDADIFRRRGTLAALFSSSFFDTRPFERNVEALYSDPAFWNALTEQTTENRLLLVGATDVESGRFRRFDFARLLLADKPIADKKRCLVEATLASAAIPGLFPPRRIGDRLYVDAGVRQSIFLDEIVEELDRSRSRATVYLLINGTLDFSPSEVDPQLFPLISRNHEILSDEGMRSSLIRVLDRARFRGWSLRAAAISEMPDCDDEDGTVFSACVTEALFDHGRALALSDDPWLTAAQLRRALEEGRIQQ
ncbi:MAG: patatin-like phospholipase family protein [Pseudomonadota bacterium]